MQIQLVLDLNNAASSKFLEANVCLNRGHTAREIALAMLRINA
jgi:hypothetical protein